MSREHNARVVVHIVTHTPSTLFSLIALLMTCRY